jgi:hypothetical protein
MGVGPGSLAHGEDVDPPFGQLDRGAEAGSTCPDDEDPGRESLFGNGSAQRFSVIPAAVPAVAVAACSITFATSPGCEMNGT